MKKFILASLLLLPFPAVAEIVPQCALPDKTSFGSVLSKFSNFLSVANMPITRHSEDGSEKDLKLLPNIQDAFRSERNQQDNLPRHNIKVRVGPPETYVVPVPNTPTHIDEPEDGKRVMRPVLEQPVMIEQGQKTEIEPIEIEPPVFVDDKTNTQPSESAEKIEVIMRENSAKLSPKTEAMIDRVPANLGVEKTPANTKRKLVRGGFLDESEEIRIEAIDESEAEDLGSVVEDEDSFKVAVKNARGKKHENELLAQGLKALSHGQYESAIALYKKVLDKSPRNRDALFGVATSYHKAGKKPQARDAYKNLLTHYPRFEEGINNLLVLAGEEAPAQALKEIEELEKRNPHFSAIYAQKAVIYSKLDLTEKAIENMAIALKLEPDNNAYRYNLAVMLDDAGYDNDAVKLYQLLLEESLAGREVPASHSEIRERLEFVAAR